MSESELHASSDTPQQSPAAVQDEPAPALSQAFLAQIAELVQRAAGGANWFFWVAGLSMINSLILLNGGETFFVIGLGVTLAADILARSIALEAPELTTLVTGISFGFDVVVALIVCGFGWLSRKRHLWAFALGMVLYALDGLLFVLIEDWMSVGFHAFALFCMGNGFLACRRLNAIERSLAES